MRDHVLVLGGQVQRSVVVPPELKEENLLVKREEWDKTKSLLDKTITRMVVVQAEFEKNWCAAH